MPAAAYGVLGLAVGSFLNVCIYRIPRGESVVLPRSHCPQCGKAIRPYDNIPVLSYLLLGGRCRFCRAAISPQYPLVEILTGLAFYACAATWYFTPPTYVNSLLAALVLALMFIDYHHQILPNVLTLRGAVAGVLLSPFQQEAFYADSLTYGAATAFLPNSPHTLLPWAGSMIGAVIGGGVLWAVGAAYKLVRGRQGLGLGDVKMMAMVGAFLGWRMAILTVFAGSALGSIIGIFLVIFHGRTLQTKLAFGTFLGAATLLSLFAGLDFTAWYASRTEMIP